MFGINQSLSVVVCESPDDAIAKGYDYKGANIAPLAIDEVIVVKKGMQNGKSTVDIILRDTGGNKYVTMVTGDLLKMLPL